MCKGPRPSLALRDLHPMGMRMQDPPGLPGFSQLCYTTAPPNPPAKVTPRSSLGMKDFALVLVFTAATAISWGVYGPVLNKGTREMGGSHLWPFICVGLAYFIIAVLVPLALIKIRGEVGRWTRTGFTWSFVAGAAGALGALGVIMAFKFGGAPAYVMPIVFGCAPVVNTFTTMGMNRTHAQPSPIFYAGLILVAAGAVTVLFYKPGPAKPVATQAAAAASKTGVAEATKPTPPVAAHVPASAAPIANAGNMLFVTLFV